VYASFDIIKIDRIRQKFVKPGVNLSKCIGSSEKYARVHGDNRKSQANVFYNHGFLLREILEKGTGLIARCTGCLRQLHQSSFSKSGWKRTDSRKCYVCAKVSAHTHHQPKRVDEDHRNNVNDHSNKECSEFDAWYDDKYHGYDFRRELFDFDFENHSDTSCDRGDEWRELRAEYDYSMWK
jgi:hypothetical protein